MLRSAAHRMTQRAALRTPRLTTSTGMNKQDILRPLSTAEVNLKDLQQISPFRPWKTPKIESHGDYREEAWLEDHIGGPLYEKQTSLPRLPVPSVAETLERFLPTALPLAKTQQEVDALKAAVQKFPLQANKLQQRLQQRQQTELDQSSWLQLWWNQLGYLQVRDPVVINVSYFFHLADDPTALTQVQRGAALLTATADYRRQVCSGQKPADTVGRGERQKPLCSVAYKYMFHGTRVPAPLQDSYAIYDPSQHHHAIVACDGHFFAMDFCHPVTGDPYPLEVLEAGLQECKDLAVGMSSSSSSSSSSQQDEKEQQQQQSLGWLTSQNRDDWAEARQALLQASPKFEEAFEVLQSGAILLCLDDDETVLSRQAMAQQVLHAGQDASAGGNRWFDKSIQLILTPQGKTGLLGEHSMMDGMPMVGYANRLAELTYQKAAEEFSSSTNSSPSATSCHVRPIFAEALRDVQQQQQQQSTNAKTLESFIAKGKDHLIDLVDRHDLHVQSFRGYGSDFIKKSGYSPDAFVQMAIQLATYRLWGEQAGTYEASQVRPFLHGRTETTRTVSPQNSAFCREMGLQPKLDEHDAAVRKEKLRLLQEAVSAQVKYTGLAAKAQGVDRHFFGLSMLVKEGEDAPDLYADPVFARSKRWRVSTSNLTHPKFENWGYGEVVPDGVGLAYSVHKRHCIFNIVALKEQGWTDKLSDRLEEALLEMRTLIEMDEQPKSKL